MAIRKLLNASTRYQIIQYNAAEKSLGYNYPTSRIHTTRSKTIVKKIENS